MKLEIDWGYTTMHGQPVIKILVWIYILRGKNRGPVIILVITAHRTLTSTLCEGTSCNNVWFSAGPLFWNFTWPLRWNKALSLSNKCDVSFPSVSPPEGTQIVSCFTVCVKEFVNNSSLRQIQNGRNAPICYACQSRDFMYDMCNIAPDLSSVNIYHLRVLLPSEAEPVIHNLFMCLLIAFVCCNGL
jgi:hypothetical protein